MESEKVATGKILSKELVRTTTLAYVAVFILNLKNIILTYQQFHTRLNN